MLITLITDFGLHDPYVAVMKGIILGIAPKARIVDISHGISPQDTEEAAWVLERAYRSFSAGTIHVVVVDPGVGTERAILGIRANEQLFLAPDNGILKIIFNDYPEAKVVRITNRNYFREPVSNTFQGRDIFAPVAAALAEGTSLEIVGEPFSDYIRGELSVLHIESEKISGEIVAIDRFGNGITNINAARIPVQGMTRVSIGSKKNLPLVQTFTDVSVGEVLAFIGSFETLEIAVRNGNAHEELAFHIGDQVTAEWS